MKKNQNGLFKVDYLMAMTFVFFLLAFFLVLNIWGHPRSLKRPPILDETFFAHTTVRDPLKHMPKVKSAGFEYECISCHQHFSPSPAGKQLLAAHEDIIFEHGHNDRC